ncbi:Hist-deacetyl domain-containing protein [Aphelenchoides fujianensis]|nr:Hist-deacetyl domain-containing protein [Aphelenchoides fujianensis]
MCTAKKADSEEESEILAIELRRERAVKETKLYEVETEGKLPIVYSSAYNIHFLGLEKLHPFDSKKWGHVIDRLIVNGKLTSGQIIEPREATREDLRVVHTSCYLKMIQCPAELARIVEIAPVAFVPYCILNRVLLKPMRFQTGGTILAASIALERGFAINIYPHDYEAKEAIKCAIRLESHTEDGDYLPKVRKGLATSLDSFSPDLIVYNAGTDCLEGDPLGRMDLSAKGVIRRDTLVFKAAAERKIPVLMVTSGGYTSRSAEVIADSIANLLDVFILNENKSD